MWRFIREMQVGDLVVVPYGSEFYVAEITGPATYDEKKVDDDAAYRRTVNWKPIPRDRAKSALISRMKIQGASAYASDLLPEIQECWKRAASGDPPNFLETGVRIELLDGKQFAKLLVEQGISLPVVP